MNQDLCNKMDLDFLGNPIQMHKKNLTKTGA